jgi:hypothetical protein
MVRRSIDANTSTSRLPVVHHSYFAPLDQYTLYKRAPWLLLRYFNTFDHLHTILIPCIGLRSHSEGGGAGKEAIGIKDGQDDWNRIEIYGSKPLFFSAFLRSD